MSAFDITALFQLTVQLQPGKGENLRTQCSAFSRNPPPYSHSELLSAGGSLI